MTTPSAIQRPMALDAPTRYAAPFDSAPLPSEPWRRPRGRFAMQIFNAVSNYRALYAQSGKVLESQASSASHQQGSSSNESNGRVTPPDTRQGTTPPSDTDRVTISEAARRAVAQADELRNRQADDQAAEARIASDLSLTAAAQLLAWTRSVTRNTAGTAAPATTGAGSATPTDDAAILRRSHAILKTAGPEQRQRYLQQLQAHYEYALADAGLEASAALNPLLLNKETSDRVRRSISSRITDDPALSALCDALV